MTTAVRVDDVARPTSLAFLPRSLHGDRRRWHDGPTPVSLADLTTITGQVAAEVAAGMHEVRVDHTHEPRELAALGRDLEALALARAVLGRPSRAVADSACSLPRSWSTTTWKRRSPSAPTVVLGEVGAKWSAPASSR